MSTVPRGFNAVDVLGGVRPDIGDPDALLSFATHLGRGEVGASGFVDRIVRGVSELESSTTVSVAKLVELARTVVLTQARQLAGDVAAVVTALRTYAAALAEIRVGADGVRGVVDDQLAIIVRAKTTIEAALSGVDLLRGGLDMPWGMNWALAPSAVAPPIADEVGSHAYRDALARWHDAIRVLRSKQDEYQGLQSDRIRANMLFTTALGATTMGRRIRTHGAHAAAAAAAAASIDARPETLAGLIALLTEAEDPVAVAEQCAVMTPEQLALLSRHYPEQLGNLDGVPYRLRNIINRRRVAQLLADPEFGEQQKTELRAIVRAVEQAQAAVAGTVPIQLIGVDFGDPNYTKAAISVGDSDTARYVTPLAFGINTTVNASIENCTEAAVNVQNEKVGLLNRFGDAGGSATVVWLGYDSGNAQTVTGDRHARVGAVAFAQYLGGVHAVNPSSFVVPVTHSYGTRMGTYALMTGATADAVVLLGSPGVADGVTAVAQLTGVPEGGVYASRASGDGWANVGLWLERLASGAVAGRTQGRVMPEPNRDPVQPGFGATVFSSEMSQVGSARYASTTVHDVYRGEDDTENGYFSSGTSSLHNVALIALGRGGEMR